MHRYRYREKMVTDKFDVSSEIEFSRAFLLLKWCTNKLTYFTLINEHNLYNYKQYIHAGKLFDC